MATVLDPKSIKGDDSINLTTIDKTKKFRIERVKKDLDKHFVESELQGRAQVLRLPYIDLYGYPIDTAHLILVSKERAEQTKTGVFTREGRELYLASPDPYNPEQQLLCQELLAQGYTYKLHLCSEFSFEKLLNTYSHIMEVKSFDDDVNVKQTTLDSIQKGDSSLDSISSLVQHASLSEIVEVILASALKNNASDIHLEPEKEKYNLRLRLDGVLHTFAELTKEQQKKIESRVKLMSKLKLNVDNVPQDGRFTFKADNKDIDVRVSMLPSNYGYSIVMRLLGTGSVQLSLPDLGFTGLAEKRVSEAVSRPQGLILTTGPTGSGKTTTLYTFLSELNDGDSKIITLEDPIEYKLPGVSQTQIDKEAGYTFSDGLRSILRQDPDVVMIGEIRDPETADIAIQASLTGHQVLSTVHTNDAAGAIPRLMDMGIKGFLLADSLAAIIGQRLVRRLCPHCKHEVQLTEDQVNIIQDQVNKLPTNAGITLPSEIKFYGSKGCKKCNGLGYKGRVGCYEVMSMTPGLRAAISERFPSIQDVRKIAMDEGMITMFQDGLLKAIEGTTSVEELLNNIDYS